MMPEMHSFYTDDDFELPNAAFRISKSSNFASSSANASSGACTGAIGIALNKSPSPLTPLNGSGIFHFDTYSCPAENPPMVGGIDDGGTVFDHCHRGCSRYLTRDGKPADPAESDEEEEEDEG